MGAWRRCCVVAAVLCLSASTTRAAEQVSDAATVDNPVKLQPFDQLSATHERPLFSPTRRPPPPPPAAVASRSEPPPPPPPPTVVVLGIVMEDGDGRAAIRAADKVVRVRTGDDVSGWKVERIEPRRLVLALGERMVDFKLFSAAPNGAKVKAADAAAAQRRARQAQ
jgi:general secretion pathway protein N